MAFHFWAEALAVMAASIPAGIAATFLARSLSQTAHPSATVMTIVTVLMGAWAFLVMPGAFLLSITCVLGWTLLVLATVDALAYRLPDIVTLPLLAAGLLLSWWLPDKDVIGHAIGALLGAAFFYAIAYAYRRARGFDGLGMGDVKLAGSAGAWLGWQALPTFILLACAVGLFWAGIAMIRRGKIGLTERIPFGVALCVSIWIVWLYGPLNIFAD